MKHITHNIKLDDMVVEFDDNNMEHVLAGPDYGQPWGDWNGWEEPEWYSKECGFEETVPVVV